MGGSKKKKKEQKHVRYFLHKTCNQEVSHCRSCKTTAKKCRLKSVLHVQSCCFANQTYCCFFTVLVYFAAQHYTIIYFVQQTVLKYYRELRFWLWLNLYIIVHYYQEYYNETLVFSKILRPGSDAAPLMPPSLTDELSAVKERRLNKFSAAVLVWCGKSVKFDRVCQTFVVPLLRLLRHDTRCAV